MERSGAGSGKSCAAWALPIFNAILYIKKGGQFQFLCTFLALSGSRKDGGSRQKQKERKGTTQSAKNNNQNRFYVNSEPTAIIARDDWLFICERGGFFLRASFTMKVEKSHRKIGLSLSLSNTLGVGYLLHPVIEESNAN